MQYFAAGSPGKARFWRRKKKQDPGAIRAAETRRCCFEIVRRGMEGPESAKKQGKYRENTGIGVSGLRASKWR
jgi:hypothetical protein